MASISRCNLILILGTALALGCGGDDEKDKADEPTPPVDAGTSTMVDSSRPIDPATAELAPQVAGKACAGDSECTGRGAKCLPRLTLGSAGPLIKEIVGIDVALDSPGGYCSASCTSNVSCGAGGLCFGALPGVSSGECRKTCTADTDCRDGYECAKQGQLGDAGIPTLLPSTCQPRIKPVPIAAGIAGKPCTQENAATTCGGGSCLAGLCTSVCLTDAECGAGARCRIIPSYGTIGGCEETCSADADCNAFTGESGVIGCTAGGVCGAKQFPLQPGVVGKACTDRAQCGGSSDCATMLGAGQQARPAPEGYCSLANCPNSMQCGGGTCVGQSALASRCYKTCTADTDCRMGYTCQDRMSIERMPAKVCAPAPAAAPAP